jgi:N-acetylglutamate synthase-like GNAT family acetyltransferase
VVGFFRRNGFEGVTASALPDEKWRGYDPARRARVVCLRRKLEK